MKKCVQAIAVIALLPCLVGIGGACAQPSVRQRSQPQKNYYLPKAGFPVLTGEGGGSGAQSGNTPRADLPVINGLHLQEGLNRRDGAGTQPYDPGEPTVRWDARKFPIKIWISPGQQLPPLPLQVAEDDRPTRIHNMLQNSATYGRFEDLPICNGFKSEMCDTVAQGIETWRDLHKEGVIRFGFVDRPEDADVLVFFTDSFPDSTGPGGNRVGAHTTGRAYTAEQIESFAKQGLARVPVIMEFNVSEDSSKMQAEAAHEFGHALGIVAHSPYREDLMYLYRIVETPSPADKATLRLLYRNTPKLWRY